MTAVVITTLVDDDVWDGDAAAATAAADFPGRQAFTGRTTQREKKKCSNTEPDNTPTHLSQALALSHVQLSDSYSGAPEHMPTLTAAGMKVL